MFFNFFFNSFFIFFFLKFTIIACNCGAHDTYDTYISRYVMHLMTKRLDHIAIKFLKNLIIFNNKEALHWCGVLLIDGIDLKAYPHLTKKEQANIFFKRAAKLGFAPSWNALGDSYYSGDGIKQSYKKAFACYQKAANQGYGVAQFQLAILYKDGKGVHKNEEKAIFYLEKASLNQELGDLRLYAQQIKINILK
jgi:hypothetical protein